MRPGFALAFVLLIAGAVTLLTIASLTLATQEALIAAARLEHAPARREPVTALKVLARQWPGRGLDALPIGAGRIIVVANVPVTVRRTAWGLYHAAAGGSADHTTRTEAIYRTLDFERMLEETNQAVAVRGSVLGPHATVQVADPNACTLSFVPARDPALVAVPARHHALGLPDVLVDSSIVLVPDGYAIGGARWSELEDIADRVLGPLVDGAGDTASTDPSLYYATGDLELAGGSSRGILFVNGNLRMTGNAAFTGIVVVRGVAHLVDGALTGSLLIQGTTLSDLGTASITHSRCLIAAGLLNSPAMARLIKAQRLFIPAF